jgi:nucleoid-associated protein YgaU
MTMGLFSFLKNAGPKLFGGKKAEEATAAPTVSTADRLEQANKLKAVALRGIVSSLGLSIDNLEIQVNDDAVVVSGQTETQSDREKVILAIGNVDGIATVTDHIKVVTPEPEAKFYEVQKGDSLSKIAKEYYGDAMKYPVIFEANKPMLTDPNLIYPGQVLRIPALEA